MAHPVTKVYRDGSPGALRRKRGLTLTALKKQIAASANRTGERRTLHQQGLLGTIGA